MFKTIKYNRCALPLLVVIAVSLARISTVFAQEGENPFTNKGEILEETLEPPSKNETKSTTNRGLANPRPPKSSRLIQATKRDCQRLTVLHKPRADVAYVPGVDVRGSKHVPAVGEEGRRLSKLEPDVIEFTLSFNPLQNTGLASSAFGETSMPIGKIKYDINSGYLTLDGEALSEPVQEEFMRACRAAGYIR